MASAELSDDTLDQLAEWVNARRADRDKKGEHKALLDAIENRSAGLSDEDVEKIARRVLVLADEDAAAAGPPAGNGGGAGGGGSGDGDPPPPAKNTATRKGRKRGNAYNYDVDDKGRQVPIGVAKIYNGEDEPDEVEYDVDDEGDE